MEAPYVSQVTVNERQEGDTLIRWVDLRILLPNAIRSLQHTPPTHLTHRQAHQLMADIQAKINQFVGVSTE